jgi:hypothetical protein
MAQSLDWFAVARYQVIFKGRRVAQTKIERQLRAPGGLAIHVRCFT